MAKWKGITAEELLMLREIQRVNRQIREAANVFGKHSGLYRQYQTLIAPYGKIGFGIDQVRETADGVLQLSTGRRQVKEMLLYTQYQNRLQRLGKMPTVHQVKQQYLKAHEVRSGKKVKGRKAQKEVFENLVNEENLLFREADELWQDIYKRIRQTGERPVEWAELKSLAKSARSDIDSLRRMVELQKEVLAKERWEAVRNVVDGY